MGNERRLKNDKRRNGRLGVEIRSQGTFFVGRKQSWLTDKMQAKILGKPQQPQKSVK